MKRLSSVQLTWIIIASITACAAVYNAIQAAQMRGELLNTRERHEAVKASRNDTLSRLEAIQGEVAKQEEKGDALELELDEVHGKVSLLRIHTRDLENIAEELTLLDEAIQNHKALVKEFEAVYTNLSTTRSK